MAEFAGQVAIITGGAQGIGEFFKAQYCSRRAALALRRSRRCARRAAAPLHALANP
jgi:hypothetical protein